MKRYIYRPFEPILREILKNGFVEHEWSRMTKNVVHNVKRKEQGKKGLYSVKNKNVKPYFEVMCESRVSFGWTYTCMVKKPRKMVDGWMHFSSFHTFKYVIRSGPIWQKKRWVFPVIRGPIGFWGPQLQFSWDQQKTCKLN